ncbi:RNA polymerase sigma factor [Streptomyces sp. NPDC002514]|uniref:RNA polymerase sigma factor n=1 Tax=Streptomyces sp. NPDC001270 TaxID=3364554 RepID=UPI00367FC0FF
MSDFSPSGPDAEAAVVRAAQAGDQRALDTLVADHLPLVYNVVGRSLNASSDTDDVVQDVMLQMVRDVGRLRDPAAFRSWLVAIAMRQVRRYWRIRRAAPPSGGGEGEVETAQPADPGADFADLSTAVLHLSDQRRETAGATRWLDADDRELLAVWWMEVAGQLSRAELAAALEIPPAQAGVRVQRMKARLEVARAWSARSPRCPAARHSTGCCTAGTAGRRDCGASGRPGTCVNARCAAGCSRKWCRPSGCSRTWPWSRSRPP